MKDLDGYYFRVKRNGGWHSVCFTDLTSDEANDVIKDKDYTFLNSLYEGLVKVMLEICHEVNENSLTSLVIDMQECLKYKDVKVKVMIMRNLIIDVANIYSIGVVSDGMECLYI